MLSSTARALASLCMAVNPRVVTRGVRARKKEEKMPDLGNVSSVGRCHMAVTFLPTTKTGPRQHLEVAEHACAKAGKVRRCGAVR